MKRRLAVILIIAVLLLHVLTVTALALSVNDVAGEFICNCGCNELLTSCEMDCGKQLRGFIKQQIDKGMGKEQIMRYMKVNFSEALLAAPEKSGFNWIAWITPFVVVVLGGVFMERAIHGWAGRNGGGDHDGGDDTESAKPGIDKKYSDRIEEELKDFGW